MFKINLRVKFAMYAGLTILNGDKILFALRSVIATVSPVRKLTQVIGKLFKLWYLLEASSSLDQFVD